MLFHFICLVVSFAVISLDAIQNCVTDKNGFSKAVFIRYLNYIQQTCIQYCNFKFALTLINFYNIFHFDFPFLPSLLLVFKHLLVTAHFECSTIISSCSNSPQNIFLMFIYPFIQTGDI